MAHGGGHGAGGALKEFFIALGLDADSAAFAAATAVVHGLEKGLEVAYEAAEKLADAFVETVHETIEWGEGLETASVMLGQTTEALQLADYQAKIANVTTEEMRMGYVHLARSMVEARDGNYELQATFAKLHTRLTDSSGKLRDQSAVLEDVAEGIRKLPTAAERSAYAMQVFGRSGARLIPLLMKGKEGLGELREEAEALGIVLSGEQVEAAAKAGEGLKRLSAVATSVEHELAGPFIDALNPILDGVLEWVKANRALISTKVREWATRVADGLVTLTSWLLRVGQFVNFVVDHWTAFVAVMATVTGAMALNTLSVEGAAAAYMRLAYAATFGAVRAALAWLAAIAPVALMAAGIALVIIGIQDFIGFLQGKDSLVGRIFQGWANEAMNLASTLRSMLPPWLEKMLDARFGADIDRTVSIFGGKEKIPAPVFDALHNAAGTIPGGQFAVDRFFTGGSAAPAAPGGGRGPVTVNNSANFVVHAPAGANPKDIADEIQRRQQDFYDARTREMINSWQGG